MMCGVRTKTICVVALLALCANALEATPSAHKGLRSAVDAGEYDKVRSFLKIGVQDIYCGDMPLDSAKKLWSARWAQDPALARANCPRQYSEAFPVADCEGKTADVDACIQRIKAAAEDDDVEEFLKQSHSALANSKNLFAMKTETVSCESASCRQRCRAEVQNRFRSEIRSMQHANESERNALKEFLESQTRSCVEETVIEVERRTYPIADAVKKTALDRLGRTTIGMSPSNRHWAENAQEWIAAVKQLQEKFAIFGKGKKNYPGSAVWATEFIRKRMKESGEFMSAEVLLLCAANYDGSDSLFHEFSSYACPKEEDYDDEDGSAMQPERAPAVAENVAVVGKVKPLSSSDIDFSEPIGRANAAGILRNFRTQGDRLVGLYDDYLTENKSLAGVIEITLLLRKSGEIGSVSVASSTLMDTDFERAIAKKVSEFVVTGVDLDDDVRVTLKFTFSAEKQRN